MTTHKPANILCKDKVKGLCLVLLFLHLTVADVPGPCRYSVRKDHLATVSHLIENQLKNGCSVTYTFTERGNLSDMCYIKAAFPQILELIDTHFRFARSSDNGRYVEAMRALIHNMYSQNCIPPINEELEDDPVKFSKTHRGSPREALDRVLEVFSLYLELMSTRNKQVNWSCEEEYAKDEPQFTTPLTQTTGAAECRCFNPIVDYGDSRQVSMTDSSLWKLTLQTTSIPSFSTRASERDPLLLETLDPMAVHWKIRGTSFREAHGTDSGKRQMAGVFFPSAKAPFLRAVGAEHLPGFSSASSVKMVPFSTASETLPSGTESITSSVFSEASKSTESVLYRSQGDTRVMESVSTIDFEEHSMSTALDIPRNPAQSTSGTAQPVTDLPGSHASFGPQVATISSQVFVGRQSTPVLRQEFQVERTPRRPQASAAVRLTKRSVESSQDRPQAELLINPRYLQRGPSSAFQLPPTISRRIAKEKATFGAELDHFSSSEKTWQGDDQTGNPKTAAPPRVPKTWLGDGFGQLRGLPIPAIRPPPSPVPEREALSCKTANNEAVGSADQLRQDARTQCKGSGDSDGSHDSNTFAYIMAPVCGGLLLISAFYCLRRQKVCFMQHRPRAAGLSINDSHV